MKIGIVGVGPWGRVMAACFERAGLEVAAYDRGDLTKKVFDMGEHMKLEDMASSSEISIVASAAPPETTMKVFEACQLHRKPCFLTKPFLIEENPRDLTAPVFVDYVHLASPLYERLRKSATRDYTTEKTTINMSGKGPSRSYPGVLDYGAHALAVAHDLHGLGPLEDLEARALSRSEVGGGPELALASAKIGKTKLTILTGNAADKPTRLIEVTLKNGPVVSYEEKMRVATLNIDRKQSLRAPGQDPLSLLVERFLWDIDAGRINPYFVELSAAATRSCRQIREKAGLLPRF